MIFYWWRGCLLICQTEYLIYFCSCFFSLKWKFIAIFLIYGFLKDYIKIQLKWTQNGFKVPSYDIDIIPRLRLLQGKRLNHNIVEFAARKRWAVSDQWARQNRKSLFSVWIQENDFRSTMLLLHVDTWL